MSLQVNGLNIVQNNLKPQMNTTFKANPVVTTNTLERTPTTDTLVKPTQNKTKKTLLTLGAIALAGVGIFAAIKAGKAHQQKKAIQEIEKKFADLQNDIPKVQKTFKEVFLREDLTEKEALEMLSRYKEVEKIRITGSKEEYARAIFEEAKNNYGLSSTNIRMRYSDMSDIRTGGGYCPAFEQVDIGSNNPIERLMNVVHHELRHVKQTYFAINSQPERYVQAMKDSKKGTVFEQYIPTIEDILKPFNLAKPNKDIVPKGCNDFVESVIKGAKEHTYSATEMGDIYHNATHEVDARFAGESIAKLFGLMAK